MAMSACSMSVSQLTRALPFIRVRVTATLAAIFCCSVETAVSQSAAVDDPLSFFQVAIRRDLMADLAAIRPRPLNAAAIQRVETFLPQNGELQPTRQEAEKISAVREILRFHDREVIVIKVIDVRQAVVGLHARAVLLLSRPALTVLSTTELRAVVAHEIGHDFFWDGYLHLRGHPDPVRRRRLEMRCDGIAVVTLAALNAPIRPLETALRKLFMFNRGLGELKDLDNYPTLGERSRFISKLRRHLERIRAPDGLRARAAAPVAPVTR